MAIIASHYQNYTFPLSGLTAAQPTLGDVEQRSWIWRNWPLVLSILGTALVVGGLIGRQIVDRSGIPDEPISPEDWEMMIQAAQRVRPEMPRQEIITKMCAIFGPRAPYCVDMQPPGIPPDTHLPATVGQPTIPMWAILAGVGFVAFLLLK
ncbi:MAG: hypothetical protein ACYS1A_18110 [Planctomycetota bacterium]